MIYTKGKAGYHMEKSDILTASLPDANDEATDHSTIFDDVFRTIAQKMPQLLIPLINEVFHTSYSEEEHFEQLRNEHYEKYGTVITDSIIQIGNHIYHLECQSSKDKTMVIRMFEYDISIAIEHASYENDEIWEIEFPQSCVLYIRNHRDLPDYHEAVVKFADGQKMRYRVPILQAKKYTVDRIFEKRLLILLPYHILRYEHFLKHNGMDTRKLQQLLADFREINRRLEETAEKEGFDKINFTGSFYTDEEYPGCPYCGAKKCFVCGNCGKVSCYDGSDKVVCNWCGSNGTAADDDGALDVSGGGF